MTLDEAIEHCKEKVNDSPCGQNHLQLMNWLIELKHLKGGDLIVSPLCYL